MVETSKMIKTYMEANGKNIEMLIDACDLSARSIFRILNGESKLTYEFACGINKLIPELTVEFIMAYDAKYQVEKRNI